VTSICFFPQKDIFAAFNFVARNFFLLAFLGGLMLFLVEMFLIMKQ